MKANLIRYKKKDVTFDYFTVYSGYEYSGKDGKEWYEGDDIDVNKAASMWSQICPWCVKKYNLYEEMNTTPEKINEEIKFYEDDNTNPKELDFTCGVSGCDNGAASQDFDVDWNDCEIIG